MKTADRIELMAMLGLFGAIISGIQMYPCLHGYGVYHYNKKHCSIALLSINMFIA